MNKEEFLKELFDAAQGKPSHYLFLYDTPEADLKALVKEGYIKPVQNTSNKPMYVITYETIVKFRTLESYEESQIQHLKNVTEAEKAEMAAEIAEMEKLKAQKSNVTEV